MTKGGYMFVFVALQSLGGAGARYCNVAGESSRMFERKGQRVACPPNQMVKLGKAESYKDCQCWCDQKNGCDQFFFCPVYLVCYQKLCATLISHATFEFYQLSTTMKQDFMKRDSMKGRPDSMKQGSKYPVSAGGKWDGHANKKEFDQKNNDLPPDWRKVSTAAGKPYYVNDKTRKAQWERPEGTMGNPGNRPPSSASYTTTRKPYDRANYRGRYDNPIGGGQGPRGRYDNPRDGSLRLEEGEDLFVSGATKEGVTILLLLFVILHA